MDKEKLRLTEKQIGSIVSECNEEYEHVESIHTSHDGEKGAGYFDLIIMRVSDEKFFKSSYSIWSAGIRHYNRDFIEVERIPVTTYIYR